MGLGAGGRIRKEIFADDHGLDTWEPTPLSTVRVELVDALAFEALTVLRAPGPVIDARTYTDLGLRWFDLLEPTRRDLRAAARLTGVRSIADLEGRRELPCRSPRRRSCGCCA